MKKAFTLLVCITLLTSCSSIASSVMEDIIQYGINESPKNEALSINNKAREKERTKMMNDGKCPVCKGMGKSADGKYTCKACGGTGKYNNSNNNNNNGRNNE